MFPLRANDEIDGLTNGVFEATESFSYKPFKAVSIVCFAKLFCNGDAEAG